LLEMAILAVVVGCRSSCLRPGVLPIVLMVMRIIDLEIAPIVAFNGRDGEIMTLAW
jgi:hypothetical protein